MSLRRRSALAAAAALAAFAALSVPAAAAPAPPGGETTLQMALRVGEGRLSQRRLTALAPHLDTVLEALGGLAAQDEAASASGAPITRDVVENVRASVRNLARVAAFNRVPDALLAELLREGAASVFAGRVPPALQDAGGGLNAALLLEGVVGRATRTETRKIDTDYLAAINGEGARTRVAAPAAAPVITPTAAQAGDAAPAAEPDPFLARIEQRAGERWITVEVGDTLGSIAVGVYGDSLDYQRIYAANRDVLTTPNTIAPGQRLRLPQ